MEQKVRICLQFSNPNQGGGPPSSANPLQSPLTSAAPPPSPPPTSPINTSQRSSSDQRTPPSSANVPRHDARGTNTSREIEREREREIDRYRRGERKAALPKRRRQLHRQRPPIPYTQSPSLTRRPYTHRSRIILFFPTFPCPSALAVSFCQTRSLPNYLPVLAPNAFVKWWNKLVDSSQILARRSSPRTRRPRKLPLTNVLFIPRHGSCTPHSTNFITRVFPFRFYSLVFRSSLSLFMCDLLSLGIAFSQSNDILLRIYIPGLTSRRKSSVEIFYNEWIILLSFASRLIYVCMCPYTFSESPFTEWRSYSILIWKNLLQSWRCGGSLG